MKSILVWCASIAIATIMVISAIPKATTVFAAAGDLTGGAWSANIGWIGMGNEGASYGVKVATTGTTRDLSGYAWSPNIGWINFNNTQCPPGYNDPCQPRVEWGANGGPSVLVKGFVRACSVFVSGCSGSLKPDTGDFGGVRGGWDGFISLGDSKPNDPISYGVRLNTATGDATGFGWGSEVVGWVDFTGIKVTVVNDPIICPDRTTLPPGSTLADCPGGGGGPSCPDIDVPGTTCYCDANPTDYRNCPNNCPANPDPNTNRICWCQITANQNDPRCQDTGGICPNIPDEREVALGITDPVMPPYRKLSNGNCACVAGYVMNPVTFACTKPIYTER